MLSTRRKVLMATLIAAGGIFLAWRALDRAAPVTPRHAQASISDSVRSILELQDFDTVPTEQALPEIENRIRSRTQSLAEAMRGSGALPANRAPDLATAFAERLTAVLAGNAQANLSFLNARGYNISGYDPAQWEAAAPFTRLAPISLEHAEIRVIFEQGRRVSVPDIEQGFGVLTTEPGPETARPVPADAAKGKLDVIEVRLPMRKLTADGKTTTSLVGFQFAWSVNRGQWVPWRNVVYSSPNERHVAMSFF